MIIHTLSDKDLYIAYKGCEWQIEAIINAMQEAERGGELCEYTDEQLDDAGAMLTKCTDEIHRRSKMPLAGMVEELQDM